MNENQSIMLASLVVSNEFQTRVEMNEDAIADYADAIRNAGRWPFPPIKVVRQVLVDGFHRIEAARRVIAAPETPTDLRKSLLSVPCERVDVDPANHDITGLALQHALAANHTHGLRRSNADKKRAVSLALDAWPDRSDREIAKLTGTSHTFASNLRKVKVATLPDESEPNDLREVATLPDEKQRASRNSDEPKPNPEDTAKKLKSLAHQHRDKLVCLIDDYGRLKRNHSEQLRLVRLVQSVSLW